MELVLACERIDQRAARFVGPVTLSDRALEHPLHRPKCGEFGALAASSCCVLPFALFTLGIGGAWIGNLTALAPYQPYFVALALAFLAGGLVLVHRKPAAACGEGSYCARPASDRVAKAGLWTSAALISLALARPYAAPLLFDL
jgi:mercuric ion transport protein